MRKLLALIIGIFLTTAAVTPALAVPGPVGCLSVINQLILCEGTMTVGDTTAEIPVVIGTNGIGTLASPFTLRDDTTGGVATLNSLQLNPDPLIAFGWAGFSGGVPTFFGLSLVIPIALSGTIDATSSTGWTLTDVAGGGVTLTATANPGTPVGGAAAPGSTVLVGWDDPPVTNKGVDIGPSTVGGVAPCTAFAPAPGAGSTSSCGSFGATDTFVGGPFTTMHLDIGFTLSATDGYSQSGALVQNVIPEPTTLFLVGSGLLGLAGWRRYSSRG